MRPIKKLVSDHIRMSESECIPNNRSTYCDYNDAFKEYDLVRQPHGLSELLHILEQSKVPLHKQKVLEGGFGTGAYLETIRHTFPKLGQKYIIDSEQKNLLPLLNMGQSVNIGQPSSGEK